MRRPPTSAASGAVRHQNLDRLVDDRRQRLDGAGVRRHQLQQQLQQQHVALARGEHVALLRALADAGADTGDEVGQLLELGPLRVLPQHQPLLELQEHRAEPWALQGLADVLAVDPGAETGRQRQQGGRPLARQLTGPQSLEEGGVTAARHGVASPWRKLHQRQAWGSAHRL